MHFRDMIGRNSSHGLPFNLSVDKLETIYFEPNSDLKQYLWPADDQPFNLTSLKAEVLNTPEAAGNLVCKYHDQNITMVLKYTNAGSVEYEMFDVPVDWNYYSAPFEPRYRLNSVYGTDMPSIQKFIDKGRDKHKQNAYLHLKIYTALNNHFTQDWILRYMWIAIMMEKIIRILIGLLSLVITRRERLLPQDSFILNEELLIIQDAFAMVKVLRMIQGLRSVLNQLKTRMRVLLSKIISLEQSQPDASNWRDSRPPIYRLADFRSNDDSLDHREPTDRVLDTLIDGDGVRDIRLPKYQPSVHQHHTNDDSCADDDIEAAKNEQAKLIEAIKKIEKAHETSNDLSWNDDDMKAIKAFLNCSGIEKGAGDQKTKAKDD